MPRSYVTEITSDGQIVLPEGVWERWGADRVVVVDRGDHLRVGPMSDDPVGDLRGKYRGRLPSTDEMRRQARAEEAEREDRRYNVGRNR